MDTSIVKKDLEQLALRLNRNHTCVLRLSKNLTSYKYEPNNYECFIRLRELKNDFSVLAEEQQTLLESMQSDGTPFEKAEMEVEASLKKFAALEQRMAAYLLDL